MKRKSFILSLIGLASIPKLLADTDNSNKDFEFIELPQHKLNSSRLYSIRYKGFGVARMEVDNKGSIFVNISTLNVVDANNKPDVNFSLSAFQDTAPYNKVLSWLKKELNING